MNTAQWPETVAAGISLIEVALGPEIAEEAFNMSWAWTPSKLPAAERTQR